MELKKWAIGLAIAVVVIAILRNEYLMKVLLLLAIVLVALSFFFGVGTQFIGLK